MREAAGAVAAADQTSAAKAGGGTGRAIPAAVKARGLAARPGLLKLTWTHQREPLRFATPAADRSRRTVPTAEPPSRTISDCCAPLITATATQAPSFGLPGEDRRSASLPKAKPVIKIAEIKAAYQRRPSLRRRPSTIGFSRVQQRCFEYRY